MSYQAIARRKYETWPCRETTDPEGNRNVESCPEAEAEFHGVYYRELEPKKRFGDGDVWGPATWVQDTDLKDAADKAVEAANEKWLKEWAEDVLPVSDMAVDLSACVVAASHCANILVHWSHSLPATEGFARSQTAIVRASLTEALKKLDDIEAELGAGDE